MNKAQLEEIRQLDKARTQGKWWWNSYSDICDENSHGIAYIANIPQAPEFEGHGDELHNPETRANAVFIAACSEAVPNLLETVDAMRELLKEATNVSSCPACSGLLCWEKENYPCKCGYTEWLAKVKEALE